jgi:hypothetical protein
VKPRTAGTSMKSGRSRTSKKKPPRRTDPPETPGRLLERPTGTAVARSAYMSRKDYRTPHEMATTNIPWPLAIVLTVSIALPIAGYLLLIFG